MEIRNEIRDNNDPPSIEFFSLESKIFKSIYKVCPNNYSEFKNRFKKKYFLSYILDNNELIGFIFLDEIQPKGIYYLRVIAVSQSHREMGLGTEMLSGLLAFIGIEDIILSFVTNTPQLFSVLSKFQTSQINKAQMNAAKHSLTEYNKKLTDKEPNSWIKNYYQMVDGSYSDGYYFLKKIKYGI